MEKWKIKIYIEFNKQGLYYITVNKKLRLKNWSLNWVIKWQMLTKAKCFTKYKTKVHEKIPGNLF